MENIWNIINTCFNLVELLKLIVSTKPAEKLSWTLAWQALCTFLYFLATNDLVLLSCLTVSLLPQLWGNLDDQLPVTCVWVHSTHCSSVSTGKVVQVPPAGITRADVLREERYYSTGAVCLMRRSSYTYLLVLFLLCNKIIHFCLNVTMHFNVADAAIQGYLQSESLWDAQYNVGTALWNFTYLGWEGFKLLKANNGKGIMPHHSFLELCTGKVPVPS